MKRPLILNLASAVLLAPGCSSLTKSHPSALQGTWEGEEINRLAARTCRLTVFGDSLVFKGAQVERLLEGFGEVNDYTAREIRSLPPVRWNGRPMGGTVPTLTEVLQLARDRAVLLHLDLKEPGLEEDVPSLLEAENLWEYVVSINRANAERLIEEPRYRPLRYRVPGLYPQRLDLDPDALRAALDQPGEMILADDPRVAAWILGRSLPKRISSASSRQRVPRIALSERASVKVHNTRHWWKFLEATYPDPEPKDLAVRLNSLENDLEVGSPPSEDESRRIATTRAWLAWKLGFLGETSSAVQHSLVVYPPRRSSKDPAPLKVKEVTLGDRRYVVCLNEEQRHNDAADRRAIVAALREQLKHGDKELIGNKGYRKYLHTGPKGHFAIDEATATNTSPSGSVS